MAHTSCRRFILTSHRSEPILLYTPHMNATGSDKSAILQGTLDLMVLKTLDAMGPMHGYGLARRIEQVGEQAVQVNQGTIYLCLVRLVQQGWVTAEWGISENNRRAKFYRISRAGRKQLAAETRNWTRISELIGRLLLQGGSQ